MIPRKWTPSDPITAERLNQSQAEASRSRRDVSLGNGSSLVNEQMGNQSVNMLSPRIKLVVALEDFGLLEVPTDIAGAIDDVPSGLVREVRLGRITATHQDDTSSVKFRAYDPAGWLSGKICTPSSDSESSSSSGSDSGSASESAPEESSTKSECDVFHVVYNSDSKRWEALGGAIGSLTIVYGVTRACIGGGWYEIELTDWSDRPNIGLSDSSSMSESFSESLSESVSESASDDACDVCLAIDEPEDPLDEASCESVQTVSISVNAGTPTGVIVYGHTAETLPLLVGGMVKMIKRGTIRETITESFSESYSQSVSDSASDDILSETITYDVYDIVDSTKPLVALPFPKYECCEYEDGSKEVKMVQCTRVIVAGIVCAGEISPCDTGSDSASASESM